MKKDKAYYIKNLRKRLGLSKADFANLLGMGVSGERTVRGWESGEHNPTLNKWKEIIKLEDAMSTKSVNSPFKQESIENSKFTFIDLFAGIGGIRLPFQKLGGHCVFTSEWDKFAQKTYLANYGEMPDGDITTIKASEIAEHDILLGGFPCQAFSQAGLKQGFSDTRGTMFFEIQRILTEKRPKAFLLENVKQLQGHNKGHTLKTIINILQGKNEKEIPAAIPMSDEARSALSQRLNYWVDYKVLRAADFGVPQNRERIFIIGFDKDYFKGVDFDTLFSWPEAPRTQTRLGEILQSQTELDEIQLNLNKDVYTISDKLWSGHKKRKEEHKTKGNGFGYSLFNEESPYANTISARYYKDGSEILIDQSKIGKNPRKLTPRECARLQGFPEEFVVDAVSHGQIYKQFGNSVCVKVIEAVATQLVETLEKATSLIEKSSKVA
ncbi:DNA cytosine methyltransferase [Pectobacterium versatile]|uniref:DNA (cytosine-5-)-methyltransferase n=1 Tax=Pectobacterium TaxID=122277 RepID=UPI000CDE7EED|nr:MULTISPECIES: DNA (cytosine-5-)-methyltransferase [Pectobacterium]KAA3666264.1 DNA (cytosine-5-)-methyltransferase [Pectobacterium carotovorum subsp. carotovorum]POY58639.1 DNA cytosine methyltransferase [Pectobacterium versatile]POY62378.1 DNA cytosine methyltransferase [Pectobacterium versatile]TAI83105.1 DNA (cytosine-5-)-methyltransferase [Pectobacterium versatile]